MRKYAFITFTILLFTKGAVAQIVTGTAGKGEIVPQFYADTLIRRVVVSGGIGLWSPSVKVEARINRAFSAGCDLKSRFIFFTGGQVEPFARYYIRKQALSGLLVELKGSAGVFQTRILDNPLNQDDHSYGKGNGGGTYGGGGYGSPGGAGGGGGFSGMRSGRRGDYELPSTVFNTYGCGAATGYQFFAGRKKRCAIELFGGLQYQYSTLPISTNFPIQKWAIEFPLDVGVRIGGVI